MSAKDAHRWTARSAVRDGVLFNICAKFPEGTQGVKDRAPSPCGGGIKAARERTAKLT